MTSSRWIILGFLAVGWGAANVGGVYWLTPRQPADSPALPPWPTVDSPPPLLASGSPLGSAGASPSHAAGASPSQTNLPAGFVRRHYTDAAGQQHRYVVYVPYGLSPEARPPLILYLNGAGKSGYDGLLPLHDGLAPAIWTARPHFPCVVLFVQSHNSSWPADSADSERAVTLLRKTAEEYQTDPDRVYLTGLSSGGAGVWALAARHPKLFAAIAPMSAGGGCDESQARVLAEARLPIWSFHVERDETRLAEFNHSLRRILLDAGASPMFTEEDGFGHNSWDFAYDNPAFLDWLLEQRRSANGQAQRGFVALSPRLPHPRPLSRGERGEGV